MKYKECFEIMGKDRNSYSKTDIEATFMRMKEDHMMNGQLKPAYNVQIAVENYFIIHCYISNDRTDYNTLTPVIEKHKAVFCNYPEEVTADSGYCSEKNLVYLKEKKATSHIKLQDHEKKKTRAYQEDIGKYYNMTYGVLNRQIRSIQTEDHFGDIKENEHFRRFNHRSTGKVYQEFMLYAIGRNINKYHRFLHGEIKKFEGKTEQMAS